MAASCRLWLFPVHSPRLTEARPALGRPPRVLLWLKPSHSPVSSLWTTLAGLRRSLTGLWGKCMEVGLLSPEPAEREGALLRDVGWGMLGALEALASLMGMDKCFLKNPLTEVI